MKYIQLTLFIMLFSTITQAQGFKVLPFKYDSPNTPHGDIFKYDKLDHFIGSTVLTMVIPIRKYNLDLFLSIGAGFLFEIKDGYQWKRSWGFSRTDLIADIAGSILGMWLKDLLYSKNIYILINKKGISINFTK